jgi:hypothetical protein
MVTYWRLSSPLAASSARASVLCALWLRLVEEAQAEEGYLAGVWVGGGVGGCFGGAGFVGCVCWGEGSVRCG